MVGGAAQRADPPLAGCQGGRVDDEGLVLGVPCCRCLETPNVGAVAELGLGVTANVFVVLCLLEELLVLLGGALVAECDLYGALAAASSSTRQRKTYQEHALVQTIRTRLTDELIGNLLVLIRPVMLDLQLTELLRPSQRRLEPVDSTSKVVLRLIKDLLLLQDLEDPVLPLEPLLCEQER